MKNQLLYLQQLVLTIDWTVQSLYYGSSGYECISHDIWNIWVQFGMENGYTYDYHCLIQSFKLFSTYILATTTYQLHRSVVCCNGHNDWHVRSVSAVLFWQICNRKLWANVRLYLLRYQLANGTIGIAEVRGVIDCQYTATYSIPWISYCFCEFGHICSRKSTPSLNWWRQSNYWTYSCDLVLYLQIIQKAYTFFMILRNFEID